MTSTEQDSHTHCHSLATQNAAGQARRVGQTAGKILRHISQQWPWRATIIHRGQRTSGCETLRPVRPTSSNHLKLRFWSLCSGPARKVSLPVLVKEVSFCSIWNRCRKSQQVKYREQLVMGAQPQLVQLQHDPHTTQLVQLQYDPHTSQLMCLQHDSHIKGSRNILEEGVKKGQELQDQKVCCEIVSSRYDGEVDTLETRTMTLVDIPKWARGNLAGPHC